MKKVWNYPRSELIKFLDRYTYYKPVSSLGNPSPSSLTDELDMIGPDVTFDELTVLKILLWKVHRYANLDADLLDRLNGVRSLTRLNRTDAKSVLEELLHVDGIDLPMASTLLRFRNPGTFQIIDRRAFRTIMHEDQYNLYSSSPVARKVDLYFSYLETIDKLCEQTGINFADTDRILYEFDKHHNETLKKKGPREGWDEQFRIANEMEEDPDAEAKENEWLKSFESKL